MGKILAVSLKGNTQIASNHIPHDLHYHNDIIISSLPIWEIKLKSWDKLFTV